MRFTSRQQNIFFDISKTTLEFGIYFPHEDSGMLTRWVDVD